MLNLVAMVAPFCMGPAALVVLVALVQFMAIRAAVAVLVGMPVQVVRARLAGLG